MDADALQRTLDAIDAVTTCGWCAATLTAQAPSPNYCSEEHQERWFAHHAGLEVFPADDLPDAGTLSGDLLEAFQIWNAPDHLVDPVPISQVLDEINADFIARLAPPPMLFTYTTPDTRLTSYRSWAERRLAYGIGLSHHEPRNLLRDINIV